MSTSKVAICNLALSHVGSSDRITALTDDTEPARICNIMYDISRQFVLEDNDWGFAEITELMALLDITPTGYTYAYQLPNGCLHARSIYQEVDGEKPIDFKVVAQSSLVSQMVLTNEENAKLVYTGNIENVNMFAPSFVMALSYQLAANIAVPITKKTSIKNAMLTYYAGYGDRSKLLDAKQQEYSTVQNNDFLQARNYTG